MEYFTYFGPGRSKRGTLARGPRKWRGETHGPPNISNCPLRDYETQKLWTWNMEGGGGEDTDWDRRRLGGRQDVRVQRGKGAVIISCW